MAIRSIRIRKQPKHIIRFLRTASCLPKNSALVRSLRFQAARAIVRSPRYPNWVTCPWPEDFLTILDYQWNEVLIPYWKKAAAFAEAHGVRKIALELHPGFCCYNPETLLKLRAAVGPAIGANLDPSHFFWQALILSRQSASLGPRFITSTRKIARSTRSTPRKTACWIRSITRKSCAVPGFSAPSATATARKPARYSFKPAYGGLRRRHQY